MDIQSQQERIHRAGQLEGWLEDVAWEDNIHKPLIEYREALVVSLVNSTLGIPYMVNTLDGPKEVPPQAIAGRVAGLDWLLRHIVRVLKSGYTAEEALRHAGFFDTPTFNSGGNADVL